jgi:recombination protein RecR
MKLPKVVDNLIESFRKLPGIGPKTAQRLTFYLLNVPESYLENFAQSLLDLKKKTIFCSICKNVTESDPCFICSDPSRDKKVIMVVEQPLDLIAFEKTGKFKGVYHVLHGRISPLENIGPDEIFVADLLKRIKESDVEEVIIATNPNMEGEATAMYLIKEIRKIRGDDVKISRLGMGIPTGADLEYADDLTLTQALEGRRLI